MVERVFIRPRNDLRRLRLLWRLRFLAYTRRATVDATIDRNVRIETNIQLEVGRKTSTKLYVGPGSELRFGCRLRLFGGTMHLNDYVEVRDGVALTVSNGTLTFDGSNKFGNGVSVHCSEWIHFARLAHAAEYATISDNAHFYSGPDDWSYNNTKTAPVEIGEDVWLCPKSTVTSGVTIGDHTIVAAGSVVIKDAPGGVLMSGVPAKVIREFDLPWRK
jgi:acetyltransferase-like isoleucine patch superfamily enzyme